MFVRQLLNAIVLNFFMTIVSLKKKFKNGGKNIIEIQPNWEFLLT